MVALFNPFAGEYDAWYDTPEGEAFFREEVACLGRLIGHCPGRWLEAGVGTGRFAAAFGIGHGVDPSFSMAAMAKQRGVDVQTGCAEQLPFKDQCFAGVLLAFTLCFLAKPALAMGECFRILKPSGRLLIGMIPRDSPLGMAYQHKGEKGHPLYSHARFRTVAEVIQLVEQAGFRHEKSGSALYADKKSSPPGQRPGLSGVVPDAGFVGLLFGKM